MVFPMDDFTGNSSRERVQRLFKKVYVCFSPKAFSKWVDVESDILHVNARVVQCAKIMLLLLEHFQSGYM